ncbi:MAG TPA: C4-type zinc ribbon domain-containing protein [Candidatus Acidoferrales bacterium]|jgi:predicted  nucleic acid-binding Zn-ribbon protein|nr:C4-type zinc ribbon domain-containing protein [Candidatus Acidoferrales bacterium]
MLPEIENLLHLQEADKAIRRLQDEIAELPKRVAAIEHKLAHTKLQLEKAQAAVKADEAARRKHDTVIADLRGKISKYRDQSLDVKTNDQYKALLHEIQFAEKEIAATEDKILELMVNADARDKEVKAAQAELKEEAAEIEKEKVEARQRTTEDEKQLTEWRGKRDQMRAGVNEDLLRHYERVSKFRGSGISEVRDHKCMACQVMLRPQTYNDVRTGQQTVVCDSCQRILYFNPANEMQALEPEHKRSRRHHPKIDAAQAWYYRQEFAEAGEVLLCLTNANGQASRRVFDMGTGRLIGDILIREGDYRHAFPEDITGAIRLNGSWSEAEMENWGTEMPMTALDALHTDLEAARYEMVSRSSSKSEIPPAVPTQHVAS